MIKKHLIPICIIALALVGCTNEAGDVDIDNSEATERVESVINSTVDEIASANPSQPEENNDDSQPKETLAFIKYINGETPAIVDGKEEFISENTPADGAPYCIVDLDSDGQNELIINRYGYWAQVFCFDGEQVVDAELGAYSSLSNTYFDTNGFAILEDINHAGRYSYSVSKLVNGKYDAITTLEHWYPDEMSGLIEDSYSNYSYSSESDDEGALEMDRKAYAANLVAYLRQTSELSFVNPDSVQVSDTSQRYKNKSLDDFLYKTSIPYNYEGGIGEIVSEYENIDLSSEVVDVQIVRELSEDYMVRYQVYSGERLLFSTVPVENVPNQTEAFCFNDMDGDGTAEVLMNSYVDSTGGFVLVSSQLFKFDSSKREWNASDMSKNLIGEDHNVRDVALYEGKIVELVDYGMKETPNQSWDYSCRIYTVEGECIEIKELAEAYWPVEVLEKATYDNN